MKLNQLLERCTYNVEDIRFTQLKDGKFFYALIMAVPSEPIRIKPLGTGSKLLDKKRNGVA